MSVWPLQTTGAYHGRSLSGHDRDEVLKNWRSGLIKAMVATKAFGLGINQPDIEVVLKIGVPPSLEELVQAFGRAGRDGRSAKGEFTETTKLHTVYVDGHCLYL